MDATNSATGQASADRDIKVRLSTLWAFATLNYLYADVVTLMDRTVHVQLSQGFLLGASVLVETAIAMVLLANVLPYETNRITNIVSGVINTLAVAASSLPQARCQPSTTSSSRLSRYLPQSS